VTKEYPAEDLSHTMAVMTTTATTPSSSGTPPATYRSIFAVREFRVLFGAQLMYVLGFEFEILGLSVLVYAHTRSAFLTALTFSMGFAPQAIGGALFTALADRLPSRTVIGTGLVVRAGPGLAIGLWPGCPVPAMLALVAVTSTVAPVFSAAISGLLPEVVDADRYVLARSVFSLTSSGGQIVGLGIGGAVLAVLPARGLLLAAGLSLMVAAAISRLGLRPRPASSGQHRPGQDRTGRHRGILRATVAGNIELFTDRQVRGLLLAQWLPAWCVTGAESLIVPYVGSLGRPASAAGPLLAAMPVGMLAGDVLVGRFVRPGLRRRLAFPLAAGMGIPLLALACRLPLPLVGALLLVCGFGFAYQLGIQRAFLDSLPGGSRAQAFGLNSTGSMGGQGLTPSAAGGLALAVGAGPAMAIAGAVTILAVLALRGPLTGRTTGMARVGSRQQGR
jgi:Major Facilitator Superfamily